MSKLALQLWDANEELIQIVIAAVYDRDNETVVTHNVILKLIGPAYALDEALAGLFGLYTDSARSVVYLTDVQLLPHFLTDVGAEGA